MVIQHEIFIVIILKCYKYQGIELMAGRREIVRKNRKESGETGKSPGKSDSRRNKRIEILNWESRFEVDFKSWKWNWIQI